MGVALVAAALAGGATTSLIVVPGLLILSLVGGESVEPLVVGLFLLLVAAVASVAFVVGLLIIGAPVWAVMHWRGLRERKHAKAAGAVLAAGVMLAAGVVSALSQLSGLQGLVGGLIFAILMVLPGAVVGWTLHRVAYGGSKPA